MKLQLLTEALLTAGFSPADQVKDFGYVVDDVSYLHRFHNGLHQYVSLCGYVGDFVEAAVLMYPKPFNSRLKPQQTASVATLYRDLPSLLGRLG